VIVPVGVGLPLPTLAATETVIFNVCAVVTLDALGVTVTAGVFAVAVSPVVPEMLKL